MTDTLVCWKCGGSLAVLPLPLAREALCPVCSAYLHVCRMCRFYDPRLAGACSEERAEEVSDKTHVNFCDYFKARPDAHRAKDSAKSAQARDKLDAFFGGDKAAGDEAAGSVPKALDELFGGGKKKP